MTRFLTPIFATAAFAVLLSPSGASGATNFGQVAMHVAYMLGNHHYSHKDFDDQVSKQLLQDYLDMLDPRHIYFTKEDVDAFRSKYETTLDDHVLMKNIEPAQEIYDLFVSRVKSRVDFARHVLDTHEFKYDGNETLEMKRDEAPWPAAGAEADALWMRLLEADMLAEVLIDENRAREEAKKAEKEKEKAAKEKAAGGKDAAQAPEKPADTSKVAETKTPEKPKEAPPAADPTKANGKEVAVKADDDEDAKKTPKERVMEDFDRLVESLEENDEEDVVNFFLSALSETYDPHTEYMSQSEIDNFQIQMKHSLVGIGALLESKEEVAEIKGIVVGGPADKQGELQLGDQITGVAQGDADFVDTKYMKLNKIVDMIRGDVDTTVRLRVAPAEDRSAVKVISIVRAEVELKEKLAHAELIRTPGLLGKEMRVGWIMLPSFYADMEEGRVSMTEDVERLLKRLMEEKIDGLVLDLRGNGGGSLEEAIKLTGLFVPSGPVVQAKDWKGNITWRDCEEPEALYQGPMIVLTDKTSASASEILAAALQDYGRAVVVGDSSTFGKGTVQTILPVDRFMPFFSDKTRAGALKVTIQKFYRIAGGSTQLKGVVPDLQLPTVRDVLDIGEASAKNPLPYDTIPPRPYEAWKGPALPLEQLQTRLSSRLESNPEFQFVKDEAKRLKDRIDRNQLSLNIARRREERDESEKRRDEQEKSREVRAEEVAKKLGKDGFKIYELTLSNVDDPELMLRADVTDEQRSGMRVAQDEESKAGGEEDFPFGMEPAKLETMHILRDLIDLQKTPPATAKTGKDVGVSGRE
ncbi:MAG: carboxy terminal-processing peptidase [Verrucomicrobiales bacterium]|nr:carboxy terminal-processing peptidase [Verrucomicrobiales bacterium]